ncbi:AAA domain-containing protein, partial [Lenzites betulinus]
DFCIITPYDAQRGLITQLLKAANLPSDIVYNVDSFQGHEAPYVIVSAVRTTRPGFLSFDNRMNVMLSRCKRGMVLVTQRTFVEGGGKHTLLGKLIRRWETITGADGVWADAMEVAAGRADMPGAPGRQPL